MKKKEEKFYCANCGIEIDYYEGIEEEEAHYCSNECMSQGEFGYSEY
jgi:hypothetical protein